MILDELLRGGHGVLTTAELNAAGIHARQIRAALERQDMRRISRGRYATMNSLTDFGQARALNGVVSGLSALSHWGIWVPHWHRKASIRIRVTRNVRRKHVMHPFRRSLARQVTVSVLSLRIPDELTGHPRGRGNGRELRRQPIDDVPTAILVAEQECAWDELVAIGDAALRQGIPANTLQELAQLGGAKLKRAFSMLDARAGSGVESLARARLLSAGIRLTPNVNISKMHVDGLIGQSLVAEFDGFEHHRTQATMLADHRRDRILHRLGYTVLRFTANEVFFEWGRVHREIRSFVAANKHRRAVIRPDDWWDWPTTAHNDAA